MFYQSCTNNTAEDKISARSAQRLSSHFRKTPRGEATYIILSSFWTRHQRYRLLRRIPSPTPSSTFIVSDRNVPKHLPTAHTFHRSRQRHLENFQRSSSGRTSVNKSRRQSAARVSSSDLFHFGHKRNTAHAIFGPVFPKSEFRQ